MKKNCLVLSLTFLLFIVKAQTTRVFLNTTGNNLWNNPTNWLPNGVPSSSDDVIIDVSKISATPFAPGIANKLTVDATGGSLKECKSFSLTNMVAGKAINLAYDLNVYGDFDLSAGGTAISFSVSGYSTINLRGTGAMYSFNSNQTASLPVNNLYCGVNVYGNYSLADKLKLFNNGGTYKSLQTFAGSNFNSNGNDIIVFGQLNMTATAATTTLNVSNSRFFMEVSNYNVWLFNSAATVGFSNVRLTYTDSIFGTAQNIYPMSFATNFPITIPQVRFIYNNPSNGGPGQYRVNFPALVTITNFITTNNLTIDNCNIINFNILKGLTSFRYQGTNINRITKPNSCDSLVSFNGSLSLTTNNTLDFVSCNALNVSGTNTLTLNNSFDVADNSGRLIINGPVGSRTLRWAGSGVDNSWNTANNWFDVGLSALTTCPPTMQDSVILDYALTTGPFKSATFKGACFCAGMSLKGQSALQTFTLNSLAGSSLVNRAGLYIGYNAGLVATTDTFVNVTFPVDVYFYSSKHNNGIATQGVRIKGSSSYANPGGGFIFKGPAKWYMVDDFIAPNHSIALREGHLELAYRAFPNDLVKINIYELHAYSPAFTSSVSALGDKRDTLTLKRAQINCGLYFVIDNSNRTLVVRNGPNATDKSTIVSNAWGSHYVNGPYYDRANNPCIQFWNYEYKGTSSLGFSNKASLDINPTFNKISVKTPMIIANGGSVFGGSYATTDTLDISFGFPLTLPAPPSINSSGNARVSLIVNKAIITQTLCTAPYVSISSANATIPADIKVPLSFTQQPQRLNLNNVTINAFGTGTPWPGYTNSVTTINSVLANTTTGWINNVGGASLFYWNGEGLGDASNAVVIKNANWSNPRNWNVSALDPMATPKYSAILGPDNVPLPGLNDDPNSLYNPGGCAPGPFDSVVFVNTSFPSASTYTVLINGPTFINSIKWNTTSLNNAIVWSSNNTTSNLNVFSSLYLDKSIKSANTFTCSTFFLANDNNNYLQFSDRYLNSNFNFNGTGTWNMLDSLSLKATGFYDYNAGIKHNNGKLIANGKNINVSNYHSNNTNTRLFDIRNSRVIFSQPIENAGGRFTVNTTNYSFLSDSSKIYSYTSAHLWQSSNSIIINGTNPLKFNDIYFYRDPANPIGNFNSRMTSNVVGTNTANVVWNVTESYGVAGNWDINTFRLHPYSINTFEAGKTITVDSLIALSQNCSAGGTIKSSLLGTRTKFYEKTGNAPLSVINFNLEDIESNTAPTYSLTGNHIVYGTGFVKSNGVSGSPLNGWQNSPLGVAYKFGFDTLKINCHDNVTTLSTSNFFANPDSYYQWKYESSPGIFTAITATNSNQTSFQPKKTGRYYVRVVYINPGCFAQDTVYVKISNYTTDASSVTPMTCNGANNAVVNYSLATNTNSNHFYQYTWATGGTASANTLIGQTSSSYSNLSIGVYTVTAIDTTASQTVCRYTKTFTINPVSSLTLSASSNSISCYGTSTATLSSSASGSNGGYTFLWTNGSNTYSLQNVSNAPTGNYTLTATDSKGCNTNTIISVTQPSSAVSLSALNTSSVSCFGTNTGSVTITATGGTPAYTYSWIGNVSTTNSANGLAAGNYTAMVTDANLCATTQSLVIIQPPSAVSINALNTTSVACFGTNTGSVIITATGGTPAYTYSWSSNSSTTNSANGLAAGNYTTTVTDANLCIATQTFLIVQPPSAVSISVLNTNSVSCFGTNTGSVTITATGGTPAYTYSWIGSASTTNSANGLAVGNYTAMVTDANLCVTTQSLVIIQPSSAVSISALNTSSVSCFGTNTGSVIITATGGTPAYTYSWSSNSSTTNSANGLSAGNYTATVTDANLCSTTQSFVIIQPLSSISISALNTSSVACFGTNTGSVTITATGGTPAYSYSWTGNSSITNSANSLAAGNYTATVTDANLCSTTQSFVIIQPLSSISISALNTSSVACFGTNTGSVTITATGGTPAYTYSWSSNSSTTNSANSLAAGNYTAMVTDENLCVATQTFLIVQPVSTLSISALNTTDANCFGTNTGSVIIIAIGGTPAYSYSWTGNPSTTNSANGLSAGNYTATVTDANLCSTTQSFIINEPTALTVALTATTQADCGLSNGSASVTVLGGTPIYNYNWTPPLPASSFTSAIASVNNLGAGITKVDVTDANGCTSPLFISISNPNAPNVTATQTNVLCYGNSTGEAEVIITGGTSPYNYTWTPNSVISSTNNATGLSAGNYIVQIVDAANCSAGHVFSITEPITPLTATAVSTSSVMCYGTAMGSATINPTGGTPIYTFTWQNNTSTFNSATTFSVGNYTYQVMDANGCIASNSFVINEPASPLTVSNTTQSNATCFGTNTGSASVTVIGGTSSYFYSWSVGTSTLNAVNNLTVGNYTVNITDANGCTISQTVTITEPPLLTASITNTTQANCGLSNGQATVTASGGTPAYTYNWATASGVTYTTNSATTASLSAGNNQVIVSDANGCSYSLTSSISNPNAPSITISVTNALCAGDSTGSVITTINGGTPNYSYMWSNGATTQNITDLPAGNYTVTVMDASNCIASQTLIVSEPNAPLKSFATNITDVNCFGSATGSAQVASVGGSPAYSYSWMPGNMIGNNINNVAAGVYTVTTMDNNACISSTIVTITDSGSNPITINLIKSEQSTCEESNGSISVNVTGGTPSYYYQWSPINNNSNSLYNLPAGNYSVIATDASGCKDTLEISIACKINLFIPELFSPNGDGLNEKFEVKGIENYPNNSLEIFNRWGSLVYSKNNYKNEWDGKANVEEGKTKNTLPAGAYFVVLNFNDDKTETYKGYVMLVY